MLTGLPPYFSANREQLFKNIEQSHLKLPRQLSIEAKNIITGLLQRNPLKRLGTRTDAAEIK